ncbi:MAG: adenylate/guanylate cyclase domain-containing protein, partial [Pseudomonadota bacterium]
TALLETYLGQGTGARVLGGEIRRGDGDDIDAAILFCDLRNSTGWAERLSRKDYLALLNAFFETVVNRVHTVGGEVLKFVGDGVLAVFPSDANGGHARGAALKAAITIIREVESLRATGIDQPVSCSIGLDFGRVTYGNVGSRDRLDFTVIGRPAIIASRLSDLAKVEGHTILATEAIARAAEGKLKTIGHHVLHNVTEPIDVYAPLNEADADDGHRPLQRIIA